MTEAEWLVCTDPTQLQEVLRQTGGVRRLCLYACACCRQWPGFIADGDRRRALDAVEAFVDGGGWEDRTTVRALTQEVLSAVTEEDGLPLPRSPGGATLNRDLVRSAIIDLGAGTRAALIREVLGNPFQRVALNPRWLHWDDDAVLREARTIYESRQFTRLSVLADALLEAGCGHRDILEHCRRPGVHVRGCWLLDRLLGKE
jgi:hypothetical protein